MIDSGLNPTPPPGKVSKTRKKTKSKTTKVASTKSVSCKMSMISTLDSNVSNASNIICSLQPPPPPPPSICGMVEVGEVGMGIGSSHCTDQIEESPLVPNKGPSGLGSVVDGEGVSQLIQELIKRQVEASVAHLVQTNPSGNYPPSVKRSYFRRQV